MAGTFLPKPDPIRAERAGYFQLKVQKGQYISYPLLLGTNQKTRATRHEGKSLSTRGTALKLDP
jgi:hypothetical protein